MRALTPLARAYLLAVYLAGAAAFFYSQSVRVAGTNEKVLDLIVFIVLAVVTGERKVRVSVVRGDAEAGSMSLGFAITFASMVMFGPGPAVMVSAASSISSCLFPKRQPLYQFCFNVLLGTLETLLGSMVFLLLNGWSVHLQSTTSFAAVIAAACTYFLVNTVGVSTIIALCTNGKLVEIWRENFLWTGASYVATAAVSAFAVYILRDNLTGFLICVVPVIFLAYQSHQVYVSRADEKRQHVDDLRMGQENLATLYLAVIKSLALAIDAKDRHTHQHILRVQRYAVAIAEEMQLSPSDIEVVNIGALLHDIGKLGVPEYVLLKPGRLTKEEFDMIKKHPEIGAAILDPVEFPWPVLPVVRHHHEKWNGMGYPDGLKGEEIPLSARIMAVADVYDALTSSRSYRKAWSHQRTVEIIKQDSGSHFDPIVVEAFLKVIDSVVEEMARDGQGPLAIPDPSTTAARNGANRETASIVQDPSQLVPFLEFTHVSNSGLTVNEMAEILGVKVANLFRGSLALILLGVDGEPPLQVVSAHGVNHLFFDKARTINAESLSARVMIGEEPFQGEFDFEDLILNGGEAEQWTDLRECMVVPLVHLGKKLGTVNVYGPEEAAFNQHDFELLKLVSDRVARALYGSIALDKVLNRPPDQEAPQLVKVEALVEYVNSKLGETEEAKQGVVLLSVSVNDFEPLVEAYGREGYEGYLDRVVELLGLALNGKGFIARSSPNGYLAALEGNTLLQAKSFAAKFSNKVSSLNAELPGILAELPIRVTIGVASSPEDGDSWASLVWATYRDMSSHTRNQELTSSTSDPLPHLRIA